MPTRVGRRPNGTPPTATYEVEVYKTTPDFVELEESGLDVDDGASLTRRV